MEDRNNLIIGFGKILLCCDFPCDQPRSNGIPRCFHTHSVRVSHPCARVAAWIWVINTSTHFLPRRWLGSFYSYNSIALLQNARLDLRLQELPFINALRSVVLSALEVLLPDECQRMQRDILICWPSPSRRRTLQASQTSRRVRRSPSLELCGSLVWPWRLRAICADIDGNRRLVRPQARLDSFAEQDQDL